MRRRTAESMKELFSSEQWSLLRELPYLVFTLVAGADDTVDSRERAQFFQDLTHGPGTGDPLQRALFRDLSSSDPDGMLRATGNRARLQSRLEAIQAALLHVLTPEEHRRFACATYVAGLRVARASGGGLLGWRDPVSAQERAALDLLARVFELDAATIDDYLRKLSP